MGRGRAKAKQTKVARDLKYRSIDTDFASLARELQGSNQGGPVGSDVEPDYSDLADQYADDVDDDGDDYDDEDERRSS